MLRTLKNYWHLLESVGAALYFRFPGTKLTIIGVTGTDGKTTTTTLIYHILTAAGIKTGILSTLDSPHMTTPGRGRVQKFLSQSLKNGCSHAVLEITSIAVDQNRVWGVPFKIGVLTNIAQNEHLDYHQTFPRYLRAKLRFLASCQSVVLNADDASYAFLQTKIPATKIVSYRLKDWAKYGYKTELLGDFNRSNILAAAAAARLLEVDEASIKKAIANFKAPSGRLEMVVRKPFTVIVDFAHTPQAFAKVLPVAKELMRHKSSKLIHVFGATGNRDKTKRPIMAEVAASFDDYIFLTHEDTYSEDPEKIIAQLEMGLSRRGYTNYEKVADRKEAIQKALSMAKSGDVVLLTGVGHQKSMNIGGKEVPWSEQKVAKEILNSW